MAIINNNVQNVKFLRNQDVNITRDAAISLLNTHKEDAADGTALLARYTVSGKVKTIVGFVYVTGSTHDITIFDTEGASGDVEALRREINAKLGDGITSANTATAQLAALSGNNESTSAETSVEGAKRYADELKNQMDYTGVTTGDGVYVTNVTQSDGIVSATTATLPTVAAISDNGKAITAVSESNGTISATAGTIDAQYVNIADSGEKFTATTVEGALAELDTKIADAIDGLDYTDTAVTGSYVSEVNENNGVISVNRVALPSSADTAQAKKVVIAVSEDKGQITVSRGEISSSAETMVLTDNADGGVNFEVNIDNDTIVQDETSKKLKVASAALTQYVGDENTIHISSADSSNNKTVSSLLTIKKVTTGLPSEVKEEYYLVGEDEITIGSPVTIYKDSHIVSITYITDSGDTHYQNLEYVYIDASGATKTEYVDISGLVLEAEFASGVTVTDHVAHGVVDPTSETFLTVGADGFKLDGVQDAINTKVASLDADESGSTEHIIVNVVEENGVITGVNVEESDIASKTDIDALSAKTITDVTSSNASITAAETKAADGTTSLDIITDADKIKMSGFTADSTSSLSGIAESDSIATAFEKTNTVITENERVIAAALTDLDARTNEISGDVETIESQYVSGISVNGHAVTVANHVAPIAVSSSQSAATATNNEAIVVTTDNATGAITLGIANIDCGYYDDTQG